MIVLTPAEMNDYKQFVFPAIAAAAPGIKMYFRDFFGPQRSASPRIARYLYQEITGAQGSLKGMARLSKNRMSDGIVRL